MINQQTKQITGVIPSIYDNILMVEGQFKVKI